MKLEDEIKQKKFRSDYQKMILNLIYTTGWLNTLIHDRLKPYGLSSQQFNILRILRGQHPTPVTVNLLQDRMLDKMSNVSRLVEKLRLKSLVERRNCPGDRRAVDVTITKKGLDQLKNLDQKEVVWEQRFNTLDMAEAIELNRLLDKLRN